MMLSEKKKSLGEKNPVYIACFHLYKVKKKSELNNGVWSQGSSWTGEEQTEH